VGLELRRTKNLKAFIRSWSLPVQISQVGNQLYLHDCNIPCEFTWDGNTIKGARWINGGNSRLFFMLSADTSNRVLIKLIKHRFI